MKDGRGKSKAANLNPLVAMVSVALEAYIKRPDIELP